MIKCVYATKIGDSILQDEDGSPIYIFPNTFYEKGAKGWWMLKRVETWWVIIRVLDKPKIVLLVRRIYSSNNFIDIA